MHFAKVVLIIDYVIYKISVFLMSVKEGVMKNQ